MEEVFIVHVKPRDVNVRSDTIYMPTPRDISDSFNEIPLPPPTSGHGLKSQDPLACNTSKCCHPNIFHSRCRIIYDGSALAYGDGPYPPARPFPPPCWRHQGGTSETASLLHNQHELMRFYHALHLKCPFPT